MNKGNERVKAIFRSRLFWMVFLILSVLGSLFFICMNSNVDPSLKVRKIFLKGLSVLPDGKVKHFIYNSLPHNEVSNLGLRTGDVLVYEFSQNRILTMDSIGLNGVATSLSSPVSINVKQKGELIVRVYNETEKGWTVGFSLDHAMIDTMNNNVSSKISNVSNKMNGEILSNILKNGRFEKIIAPEEMPEEARNHWRDILSRWQVILSDNPIELQWSRTEEDTTGVYVANYLLTNTAPTIIKKTKQRYLKIKTTDEGGSLFAENSVEGDTIIKLEPYPSKISGTESIQIAINGIGIGIRSKADFSISLISITTDPQLDKLGDDKAKKISSAKKTLAWKGEISQDMEKAGIVDNRTDTSIEEDLIALKQLFADGKAGTTEEVKLLGQIRDHIIRDESSIDSIFDTLTSVDSSGHLSSAIIGVLGAAGTEAAQLALLGIATSSDWPEEKRRMALFSFAQVTDPIKEIDGWLTNLHQEGGPLADNAFLILSAMGDRMRDINPDRYKTISEYVISVASQKNISLNNLIVALEAIGNLGPANVPDCILSAMRSDDSLVRQYAIRSLQRVYTDDSYNMIITAAWNDPSDSVRVAAIKLLADSSRVGAEGVLIQLTISGKSIEVRKGALVSLSKWGDTSQNALTNIDYVANHDSSSEVRELAKQLRNSHK